MRARTATLLAALAALAGVPDVAAARARGPHLSWVRCYRLCTDAHTVAPKGTVKLGGRRLGRGLRVVFRVKGGRRAVKARRLGSTRLLARVPANARSGRVYARGPRGVRTNSVGPLRIRGKRSSPATGTAFDDDAMWIWHVASSEGGDPNAIAQRAHA